MEKIKTQPNRPQWLGLVSRRRIARLRVCHVKPTPMPSWKPSPKAPLRHLRPKEFQTLWGYLQNHRHGIDAWHQIPAALRRSRGRTPPSVKAGSGAVEKNIEVHINRCFKRQGRSWHTLRAERLLALQQLLAQPQPGPNGGKPNPSSTSNPTRLNPHQLTIDKHYQEIVTANFGLASSRDIVMFCGVATSEQPVF